MEQNNITLLINNAVSSNNSNIYNNEQEIIKVFTDVINKNIDLFDQANLIDIENNNGFRLELEKLKKILNKYSELSPLINLEDVVNISDNNIRSDLYEKTGIILTLFNGNTYIMLEMILLGILTHNTIIFAYDKYMIGINNLLIDTIQNVIEPMGLNRYMFQHTTNIGSELFNNFKTINKTIIIGDSDFKSKYLSLATTDVLVSGYDNYDIYIESMDHKDVILDIISKDININIYVNSEIDYEFDDAIVVDDVDEAITRINYSGSNYSAIIFTNDNKSASRFIKNVNSDNLLVNASPLLVSDFNISQEQLLRKKNIIMPNIYKFNGEKMEIII